MGKRNAALEALGTVPSQEPPTARTAKAVRRYARVMLYLPPAVAKTFKQIALDSERKPHDVFVEALQSWLRANGHTREADTLVHRHDDIPA